MALTTATVGVLVAALKESDRDEVIAQLVAYSSRGLSAGARERFHGALGDGVTGFGQRPEQ